MKRYWYKDFEDKVPICLTCKYKYTITQIDKYTNTAWVKVAVMSIELSNGKILTTMEWLMVLVKVPLYSMHYASIPIEKGQLEF